MPLDPIRECCVEEGISLAELSRRLGYSDNMMAMVVSDATRCSEKLAVALEDETVNYKRPLELRELLRAYPGPR